MREAVLRYLGFQSDATVDELTEHLIDRALREVEELAEFKYVYASYDYPQEFMLAHPAYMEYLHGSEGYLLCACTIGIGVDRRLKRLQGPSRLRRRLRCPRHPLRLRRLKPNPAPSPATASSMSKRSPLPAVPIREKEAPLKAARAKQAETFPAVPPRKAPPLLPSQWYSRIERCVPEKTTPGLP